MLAFFLPETVMRIYTSEAGVIEAGVVYLRIIAVSYLFMGFAQHLPWEHYAQCGAGSGGHHCLLHFLLHQCVERHFHLWLVGRARHGHCRGGSWASVLARTLELVIVIVYVARNPDIRLRLKDYPSWPKTLFADFLKYSMPTTLNELFWGWPSGRQRGDHRPHWGGGGGGQLVAGVTRQLATVICFGLASSAAILWAKPSARASPKKPRPMPPALCGLPWCSGFGQRGHLPYKAACAAADEPFPRPTPTFPCCCTCCVFVLAQAYNVMIIVGICRAGEN